MLRKQAKIKAFLHIAPVNVADGLLFAFLCGELMKSQDVDPVYKSLGSLGKN
ncbi:hypothetical protein HMPREF3213_02894 [Heyndrickxia coagulans]|uniref:Uncharacterized protein n=1 Tax=Heyndrickxia coagulans TaxID=1398 RepID=A0A133KGR8_HEYCO|nr:hypothetical protein HMPREF3213_02894 [Heyndrickxia coagulans]